VSTSRAAQRWLAAALGAAILLCAQELGAALLWLELPVAAAALWPRRVATGGLGELLLSLLALGGGIALATQLELREDHFRGVLAPFARLLLPCSLALATLRLWLQHPRGGLMLTLGLGLAAITAAGAAAASRAYLPAAAVCLLLGLLSLRAADAGRPSLARLPGRRRALGVLLPLLAGLVASGLALGLPPLYGWVTQRFVGSEGEESPSIGFNERSMALGSLDGMLASDRVVLRLFGARRGEHLRGMVYRRYRNGRWFGAVAPAAREAMGAVPANAADGPRVRVERLDEKPGPLFLPLHAQAVDAAGQSLPADRWGIVQAGATRSRQHAYRANAGIAPIAPSAGDLELPAALAPALRQLAADWTGAATTPREQAAALVAELEHRFVYSQHFRRAAGVDPVLDFLQRGRRGHCEYFASGLALLLRSLDVPTRVVGGYVVSERHPLLDYQLVRQWDAHAWVEAWIDGRWVTLDPAPLQSTEPDPATRRSLLALALETLRYAWAETVQGLRAQGAAGLAILLLALLPVALWWQWRRRPRALPRHLDPAVIDAPLPVGRRLLEALAAAGLQRARGETLEAFAQRVAAAAPTSLTGPQGAALLRDYADLRYGGAGTAETLAQRVEAAIRAQPAIDAAT